MQIFVRCGTPARSVAVEVDSGDTVGALKARLARCQPGMPPPGEQVGGASGCFALKLMHPMQADGPPK